MTLKIGRVGIQVSVSRVDGWVTEGDRLNLSGYLHSDSVSEVDVLRQQLNGYVDNGDEEVVPVTWTTDSKVNGFYRVRRVQISTNPNLHFSNRFLFTVDLERVAGYAGPLMETVITGAVRTNSHSITNANAVGVVAVPDDVLEFHDSSDPAAASVFTRTSVDGDVRCVKSATYSRYQYFALAPADWYIGACSIELGSPYRTVVGQQIPSELDTWRLSNGLVRVRPHASGFGVSCFNGSTWDSEKVFRGTVAGSSLGGIALATGLRVLRNSPEECIIRLPVSIPSAILTGASVGSMRADIDIAVRRGERTVRLFLAATKSTTWGVECVTAEAATALTGGIRATSDDANGNRFVLSSPQAVTNDLTQGGFALTAGATTFSYAAGLELNGSSAATNDAAQALVYQYMAAHSERVVVGAR